MVPEGWKIKCIGDIADVKGGKRLPNGYSLQAENNGYPYIRVRDMFDGGVCATSVHFVPEKVAKLISKYTISTADIFMTVAGTLGLVGKIPESLEGANLTENADKLTNLKVDQNFLLEILRSPLIQNRIQSEKTSNAQPKLALTRIKRFKILVPPLAEQKKIAQILSTWDKAINTTQALIDASKQQKKALMQQLLTGKKRFSGFDAEWNGKQLHEVANIIVSPVDKKSIEGELPVKLCNYTDVYYNSRITRKLNFMKATAKQNEIDKYKLQIGDVIITKDSETPVDIAIPSFVSDDLNDVVCGYHLAIIRPEKKKVHGAFLNNLLSMQKTRYYFFTLATGVTRFGLSISSIKKAHFKLPALEEQQKIASLLVICDYEIDALQRKLAALKKEKKSLMQQLLTGKRRVKTHEGLVSQGVVE